MDFLRLPLRMPYKPTGKPNGRPKKYPDAAVAAAMRARLSYDRDGAVEPSEPAPVDDVPALSAAQVATLMRHLGARAVRFAAQTMEDEGAELKHRIACASMLVGRRWFDAPTDPSVLVQQNTLTLTAGDAEGVLARLRGLSRD